MIKREIKIDEITYTVRATTVNGLDEAVRMLKRTLKQTKKQNKEEE